MMTDDSSKHKKPAFYARHAVRAFCALFAEFLSHVLRASFFCSFTLNVLCELLTITSDQTHGIQILNNYTSAVLNNDKEQRRQSEIEAIGFTWS